MTLPIAISVPHAGIQVPEEIVPYCLLSREQIIKDGDEGAADIYNLQREVAEFISTDIARAIVDVNRSADDRRPDGVVKTHTIWEERIYRKPLPEGIVNTLLDKHYHPYHHRLNGLANRGLLFAVDCHTMAANAPPIGPDSGSERPEVCIGNVNGQSFPQAWTNVLQQCLREAFSGFRVTLNAPFSGGYITQAHRHEMPWVQLELSRSEFLPKPEMRSRVLHALEQACKAIE